jgi:hypothetical protein
MALLQYCKAQLVLCCRGYVTGVPQDMVRKSLGTAQLAAAQQTTACLDLPDPRPPPALATGEGQKVG